MRICDPCRAYLRRYASSVELSCKVLDDPPPAELTELTLRFLHDRMPAHPAQGERAPK
jgi:hypothetical protein